jgi:hypothetical protein
MWPDVRHYREPGEMSTDDLAACYGLAGRLRRLEPDGSLDDALRLWMFRARKELESRGKLELIRDWLPVYFDPTRHEPVFGPGAALAGPPGDEKDGKGVPAARSLRQIAG